MAIVEKDKKLILFVCPVFPPYKHGGGQAQVAWDFAIGLKNKGYTISVVTTLFNGLPAEEYIQGIKIVRFKSYSDVLQRIGFYNPQGLYSRLKNNIIRYDSIFVHDIYTLYGFLAAKLCKKYNIPYVLMPHGMGNISKQQDKVRLKKIFIFFFSDFVSKNASTVLFCSKNEQINYALQYNKGIVIENGIDQDDRRRHLSQISKEQEMNFRKKHGLNGKKVLFSMGRLVKAKRFDKLIQYMDGFLKSHHDYKLLIVGPDGGEKVNIKKTIASLGLEQSVIVVDGLFSQDKYTAFSLAEMFLLTSDLEGFPIVVCEAVTSNLPCLLSQGCNIDCIPNKIEIFENQESFLEKLSLLCSGHSILYTNDEYKKFDLEETIKKIDILFSIL